MKNAVVEYLNEIFRSKVLLLQEYRKACDLSELPVAGCILHRAIE